MYITINYAEYDPAEVEEAGRISEVIRDAMPNFQITHYEGIQNNHNDRTHGFYSINNLKHYEIVRAVKDRRK